jgi:hypothetical protein
VIRMFCRSLRLNWAAAGVVGLAVPALAAVPQQATHTTLLVDTRDVNGQTEATLFVAVTGADGLPASGTVTVKDGGRSLAGFALDNQGQATSVMTLPGGAHSLRAVYSGDKAHALSSSSIVPASATAGTTPDFSVAINPGSLSLKQGQSGSATVSITPINAASLTGPMFVTISCTGLPDQTSCTFTPENIEIPVSATAAINSSMVIATQSGTLTGVGMVRRSPSSVAWAFLPGVFALAGLAFGVRRRRFLSRLVLLALVAFVTVLGSTACSPLYNYYNHGPPHNLPTPAGTYNVTISAQSSNGVTATTHTTTMALQVTQ